MTPTLVAVLAAVLSSGIITALIQWAREHKKDDLQEVDMNLAASEKSVNLMMLSIERLEQELESTRAELEKLRKENAELSARISVLNAELECMRRKDA